MLHQLAVAPAVLNLFPPADSSRDALSMVPPEITRAFEFFYRPEVQKLVSELQGAVFDFLANTSEPIHAIDRKTENGNFVREGVREILLTPQPEGSNPLMLDRFGRVILVAQDRELALGEIYLASNSPMLRREFVNKTSSQHAEKSVFQLEQIDQWEPIEKILKGHPSGFALTDQQSLAAEIVMTMDYLVAYANIASHIATNEHDAGAELLRMKISANLDDCLDAARFCEALSERVGSLGKRTSADLWAELSGPTRGNLETSDLPYRHHLT